MKTALEYIKVFLPYVFVILVLAYIFSTRGCATKPVPAVEITSPKIDGKTSVTEKPIPIPKTPKPEIVIKWKEKLVPVPSDIDTTSYILKGYLVAKDSIARLKFLLKALEVNEYVIQKDDTILSTENRIKTQGTVLSFSQSYTVKERKIKAPKLPLLRLYGGLEMGNTTKFDNFSVKANLFLQNRKGDLFSGSIDTNEIIWIGYGIKFF